MEDFKIVFGDGTGLNLSGLPTREEAVTIAVRLLGKDRTAKSFNKYIPFIDVPKDSWSYGYISYAYDINIISGESTKTFNPQDAISAQDFTTILLKVLGYSFEDFDYAGTMSYARNKFIIDDYFSQLVSNGQFTRQAMFYLAYKTLKAEQRMKDTTLAEKLVNENIVSTEVAKLHNLYGINKKFYMIYYEKSTQSLLDNMKKIVKDYKDKNYDVILSPVNNVSEFVTAWNSMECDYKEDYISSVAIFAHSGPANLIFDDQIYTENVLIDGKVVDNLSLLNRKAIKKFIFTFMFYWK